MGNRGKHFIGNRGVALQNERENSQRERGGGLNLQKLKFPNFNLRILKNQAGGLN